MLEGISLSQPQPKIPPELIKYLGKTYNAWHIAIPLLESHVIIFPDETRCFDALAELYKLVNEVRVDEERSNTCLILYPMSQVRNPIPRPDIFFFIPISN